MSRRGINWPDLTAIPIALLSVQQVWNHDFSLLLCEIDALTVTVIQLWLRDVSCANAEVAYGDWRARFCQGLPSPDQGLSKVRRPMEAAVGCAANRWARPVRGSLGAHRSQVVRSKVTAKLRQQTDHRSQAMVVQYVPVFAEAVVLDMEQAVFDRPMASYQVKASAGARATGWIPRTEHCRLGVRRLFFDHYRAG